MPNCMIMHNVKVRPQITFSAHLTIPDPVLSGLTGHESRIVNYTSAVSTTDSEATF